MLSQNIILDFYQMMSFFSNSQIDEIRKFPNISPDHVISKYNSTLLSDDELFLHETDLGRLPLETSPGVRVFFRYATSAINLLS